MSGIEKALRDFALDSDMGEGVNSALRKAEGWRDALEEMQEVGDAEQQHCTHYLLSSICSAIGHIRKGAA